MSRSSDADLVGQTLAGRYVVEEVIGRGGMSLVYRARDLRLGRDVALKVIAIPSERMREEEARARLRREANAAAGIPPHPNVVQIYDHGSDAELDLDFIVMELVPGADLKSLLRTRRPSRPEATRILLEAARGVAAGHRGGLVHRDVKPANLLLTGGDRGGSVKVLDFGIAQPLEEGVDQGSQAGGHSPAYASPEQLIRGAAVTAASDVFQLGLVGYELLAGARPFDDEEREQLRRGEGIPLPHRGDWESVPAPVREVIERALRPKPEDRYADAAEFAEALAAAGGSAGATAAAVDSTNDESLADPDVTVAWEAASDADVPLSAAGGIGAGSGAHAPDMGGGARGVRVRPPTRTLQLLGAALLVLAALIGIVRAARTPEEPTSGAAAAEEIRNRLVDLHAAWTDGDIEAHAAFYADEVDFYGEDLSRTEIERERRESAERFTDREVTLERTAVTFTDEEHARAVVEKSWDFRSVASEWTGAARQEFLFERIEGRWLVTGERDLEVYRSEEHGR